MEFVEPRSYLVDVEEGVLTDASGRYEKKLKDLQGLYSDAVAFASAVKAGGDKVVYEVTDQRPVASQSDLIFGVTCMRPGKIGDEFYMTRGHIHARSNRPETYYGERGEGLMLLESPEGDVRILEVSPRQMCYVPPMWIHRSVNVGDTELVMSFCYPCDAGQNYEIIERSGGMRSRIVCQGAGWKEIPNERYVPRDRQAIASILATADV